MDVYKKQVIGGMHNILITALVFLWSIIQCTFSHWHVPHVIYTRNMYTVAIDTNTVQIYIHIRVFAVHTVLSSVHALYCTVTCTCDVQTVL